MQPHHRVNAQRLSPVRRGHAHRPGPLPPQHRAELLGARDGRDHFGPRLEVVDWVGASEAMEGATTIVNCSALGMAGQPALDISLDRAPSGALVTDIVYQPLQTPLLEAAAARGLRTVDGLGMLLHQGVPGFERWFGCRPEVDADLRAAVLAE